MIQKKCPKCHKHLFIPKKHITTKCQNCHTEFKVVWSNETRAKLSVVSSGGFDESGVVSKTGVNSDVCKWW